MILYRGIIKDCVPNNRKDDSNEEEDKSRYKNTVIITLFGLRKLACPVIGISLLLCSAHRDKGKHSVSKNKSNSDKRTLAADKQQAREKRHQNTGDEESVRQDLDIDRNAVCEKAL